MCALHADSFFKVNLCLLNLRLFCLNLILQNTDACHNLRYFFAQDIYLAIDSFLFVRKLINLIFKVVQIFLVLLVLAFELILLSGIHLHFPHYSVAKKARYDRRAQ